MSVRGYTGHRKNHWRSRAETELNTRNASINPLGVCVDRSDDLVKSLLSCLSEAIGLWPCLEPNRLVYSSHGARGTRPQSIVLSRLEITMTWGQPVRKEQSKVQDPHRTHLHLQTHLLITFRGVNGVGSPAPAPSRHLRP